MSLAAMKHISWVLIHPQYTRTSLTELKCSHRLTTIFEGPLLGWGGEGRKGKGVEEEDQSGGQWGRREKVVEGKGKRGFCTEKKKQKSWRL